MTMQCKVCSHPKRIEIDREIVNGGNLTKIARDYNVSYNSVWNHAQNHVTRQMAQVWAKKQSIESFGLLKKIDQIIARAEDIFTRNYNNGKDVVALKALDSQRSTIELLAKISYTLHEIKMAELEAKRQATGEVDAELMKDFEQKAKILTTPELVMLNRLIDKMENQSPEIIIPEEPPMFVEPQKAEMPEEAEMPEAPEPDYSTKKIHRKAKRERKDVEKMQIRPIEPTQIPTSSSGRLFL